MASREEVDFGVRGKDPVPVVLALEGVHCGPLVQVPDPDGLILTRRQDEVLVGVKEAAARVLEVASAGIDFPLDLVSVRCP